MRTIQATEAKAHLAELLRTVERGESVARAWRLPGMAKRSRM